MKVENIASSSNNVSFVSDRRLWMITDQIAMHNGTFRIDPHDKDNQLIGKLRMTTEHISWQGKYGRERKMTWEEFAEHMKK